MRNLSDQHRLCPECRGSANIVSVEATKTAAAEGVVPYGEAPHSFKNSKGANRRCPRTAKR